MASKVGRTNHPGGCDTKTGVGIFYDENKDKFSAYCFVCQCKVQIEGAHDWKKPEEKTPEEVFAEVQEIRELQFYQQAYRNIPEGELAKWGVRLGLDERDGVSPHTLFYPYEEENGDICAWKARMIMKKGFYSVGGFPSADPFGFSRALRVGGPKLWITGGENDAIALNYQMMEYQRGSKYEGKEFAVVSLPSGDGSVVKALSKIKNRLTDFKEIIMVMDNDQPGKDACKKARKLLPDILMVDIPNGCKDPHEALQTGRSREMAKAALFGARKPPVEGVVKVVDVMDMAMEKPSIGQSYPFEEFTRMTTGQHFGQPTGLGSGTSLGKTAIAHEIAAWNITEHDEKCFMVLLEERNHKTLRNIAGKIDSQPYHNPNATFDNERCRSTIYDLRDHLFLWNSERENGENRFDIESIISAIRFNVLEYGVRYVFLDNWTRLTDHLCASDKNEFLNRYSSQIEALCGELDICIHTYSHLNPPDSGVPHESGAKVFPHQFTGSRGIMRAFPWLFSFRRNKYHPEEMMKNHSYFSCIKSRDFGSDCEGDVKLAYNSSTGRLGEYDWEGDMIVKGGKYE